MIRATDMALDLKQIDQNLYTLDFPYEYGLDRMLEQGISSTYQLARFVQRLYGTQRAPRISSGGTACTTFKVPSPDGKVLLGRNFDYREAPTLLVRTNPAHGLRSIGIADMNLMLYGYRLQRAEASNPQRLLMAPYACMDGINEAGLAIAVLELKAKPTKQRREKPSITTSIAMRAVLDRCSTADEAIALFDSFDMHDALFRNYHYQVVDASGASAVIEYVDDRLRVVRAEGPTQYATNFYLSEDGDNRKAFGYKRRDKVVAALEECSGIMDEQQVMATLERCRVHYRYRGYQIATVWSSVYNCTDRQVTLCAGANYRTRYQADFGSSELGIQKCLE